MKKRNFVRLSTNNEFVEGSNISRNRRPSKDRWYEIFTPNCCELSAPTGTPGGNTFTQVQLLSGDDVIAVYSAQSTNLATVAAILNANYDIGEWSADSTGLHLVTSLAIPQPSIQITYAASAAAGTTTTTSTTTTTHTSTTSSSTSTTTTTLP